MYDTHHRFHIPVMGTGFTIDSPIRIAKFGLSSVISLVDDLLVDRVRKHYSKVYNKPFEAIRSSEPDARAKRFTAYLDFLHDIVQEQIQTIKALPFESGNDKTKYFELLPDTSPVKQRYRVFLVTPEGPEKSKLGELLTADIVPGSIDGNIMTKLDRAAVTKEGLPLPAEFSDAKCALRGFALSKIRGSMVFSAGINPTLYGYLEAFPDFYRQGDQPPKKGVILKVSDYRSSMVQGKFLARKGIEIKEFRIESGLNCGGHAFASDGFLMGPILQEFLDNRERFPEMFEPLIMAYFKKQGKEYPASGLRRNIMVTAQGGLGTHGEMRRLFEHYGLDACGWASPFLLVPEVTALDMATRMQLAEAKEDDLYLSDASPLGVPFNNLRNSTSDRWTKKQIESGRPGSPCPKGYLVSNTEFTTVPICTASKEYQGQKIATLGYEHAPEVNSQDTSVQAVYVKQCICDQLGNGALIEMGEIKENQPVSICPGPNIAYFDRLYTLREMTDHIYGRGPSLVPSDRPHFFAKDLKLTIDYFIKQLSKSNFKDAKAWAYLTEFKTNIENGLSYYEGFLKGQSFPTENFDSIRKAMDEHGRRLQAVWEKALLTRNENLTLTSTPT